MKDPFLIKVRVLNETDALRNSLKAALQHNLVYRDGVGLKRRAEIRKDWAAEIILHSCFYRATVKEEDHIRHIEVISSSISARHARDLHGERLRIGTSQKAFNLYLKFLWRLGKSEFPPHCPIDRIVLRRAKLVGSWTTSDSIADYERWIIELKKRACPKSLSEWEYDLWNEESNARANAPPCHTHLPCAGASAVAHLRH